MKIIEMPWTAQIGRAKIVELISAMSVREDLQSFNNVGKIVDFRLWFGVFNYVQAQHAVQVCVCVCVCALGNSNWIPEMLIKSFSNGKFAAES